MPEEELGGWGAPRSEAEPERRPSDHTCTSEQPLSQRSWTACLPPVHRSPTSFQDIVVADDVLSGKGARHRRRYF